MEQFERDDLNRQAALWKSRCPGMQSPGFTATKRPDGTYSCDICGEIYSYSHFCRNDERPYSAQIVRRNISRIKDRLSSLNAARGVVSACQHKYVRLVVRKYVINGDVSGLKQEECEFDGIDCQCLDCGESVFNEHYVFESIGWRGRKVKDVVFA